MKNNNAILSLEDVCFAYFRNPWRKKNPKWVLRDISFKLQRGETLGIIGRNGAGKSTLMSILAGLTLPDKGVFINYAKSVNLLSLQTGFVPQLSGRENIFLSSLTMGFSKKKIRDKLDDIIAFSELGKAIDDPVKTYSTGMRARLGFSISIQISPEIILLDEILGVGDLAFGQKSQAAMKDKMAGDQTVVLVSHQPSTIAKLCDRAIVLNQGRIMYVGNVTEAQQIYLDISHNPIISEPDRKN